MSTVAVPSFTFGSQITCKTPYKGLIRYEVLERIIDIDCDSRNLIFHGKVSLSGKIRISLLCMLNCIVWLCYIVKDVNF